MMWSFRFPSRSLSYTTVTAKAPLLFRTSTRVFSSFNPAVVSSWKSSLLSTSATAAAVAAAAATVSSSHDGPTTVLLRYFGTLRKKKGSKRGPRQERALPPPPPIVNAIPREIRRAEIEVKDQQFAEQLKIKVSQQPSVLRFDMTSMPMSDRLKRLLELTNGSQREVIKAQKERGIQLFQKREGDTGSSAVQIVALTTRIQQLQTHMSTHRKDHSTKRRLDALYVRRRKLLDYLERKDFESYRNVSKTLGLVR